MLQDLVQQPENFVRAVERYSVSVVSCVGFGRRIEKMDDIVARMALKFMEGVDLAIPGEFLIESLPLLLKLPRLIYPLASRICANNRKMTRFFTLLSREAAAAPGDTASHTASRTHSFSASLMQESEKGKLSDEEIAFLTGNLIGGGVDTTSSTTISFIFAMCAFPAVQQRAFAEISSVVQPGDRMPDWGDEENLPYCRALVSECLRWRTVTILGGIPHAPIQDDVYKGYTIPKGTWIAGNMWSIHRNPRDFPDPDQFRPERFLDERRPFPNKKGHSAFGWGRRQCSGQPLAEQGLFLTFARLLWAFEMRPALDRSVKEEQLDIFAFTESENIRPEPFGARFIPRNEARRAIIMQEATLARAYLKDFDGVTSVQMPCFE
ncbi:cytochrome P450 [Aspergillus keveii]|uniref:Cytochrome P450 n=1 Tax=Aspergillus keveii TaxID=714993 RepID=A0ABR4FK93_9EURO